LPHPKKVGTLPVGEGSDEQKQTNEIKVAVPLLDTLDIEGRNITADALHTQTSFADYIVRRRKAHYFLIAKKNQPTLRSDIEFHFQNNDSKPEDVDVSAGEHGRIETRSIWTTTELNEYLNFPHVGQAFMIKRETIEKKTGKFSSDIVYGITSRSSEEASPKMIQNTVRKHWTIENGCHYILDWNYDEDRCRIRKGYGPENVARLRKFAIGLIKSKKACNVAQKMRELFMNKRAVLDYLKMTKNSQASCQ
jgi:predicted transposase YbfD/YdcC